jgi:hypothetical protein
MATEGDFKYYALADSVQATRGAETVEVSKPKLYCVYEGFSLKFILRFGKGTDNPAQNITAVFELAAKNLEQLYMLTTFPSIKPVQCLTWRCNQMPQITNYSTQADPKKPEHEFTEILQLPGEKRIKMLVRMHNKFYLDEWDRLRDTYSTLSKDLDGMLTLYPNPSQPKKELPPIAECRSRAALNSFANREIWGTTMMAAVLRESGVHL